MCLRITQYVKRILGGYVLENHKIRDRLPKKEHGKQKLDIGVGFLCFSFRQPTFVDRSEFDFSWLSIYACDTVT